MTYLLSIYVFFNNFNTLHLINKELAFEYFFHGSPEDRTNRICGCMVTIQWGWHDHMKPRHAAGCVYLVCVNIVCDASLKDKTS